MEITPEIIAIVATLFGVVLGFIVTKLKALVAKTDNKIDDALVAAVEKAVKDFLEKNKA